MPSTPCSENPQIKELPEPPEPRIGSYLKAIGPGLILASLAIGIGEWILFPTLILRFGPLLMWTAALGCIFQAVLGLESIKYTIYCGQPIHRAYMKIGPWPKLWAIVWTLLLFIPVMWPAWALASATAITAIHLGRLPVGADAPLLLFWSLVAITVGVFIIHLGRKIQRTLEILSWPVVIIMFAVVLVGVVVAAPLSAWIEIGKGLFTPFFPRGQDWFILAAAIAYIPAGFGFNLMLSSYARDKGWGMGREIGYISGLIGGRKISLLTDEVPFDLNKENLRRWKGWINVARIDCWIVFSFLTFLTVLMTSVMAYAILAPKGLAPAGFALAAAQAEGLKPVLGVAAWFIVLLGGFFILFDTQWGLMDSVSRVITECLWFSSKKVREFCREDPRRVYYACVYTLYIIAVVLLVGVTIFKWVQPFELVALGANLGLFALTVAYPLQIVVSKRYLPKELGPGKITFILLFLGMVFYGTFLTGLILQTLFGIRL